MNGHLCDQRIMGIHPTSNRFAFIVFDGPALPVEWGIKHIRGENRHRRSVEKLSGLLGRIEPNVLVIDDPHDTQGRRLPETNALLRTFEETAHSVGIIVARQTRIQVRQCFDPDRPTKFEIAHSVSERLPNLAHLLPPPRKPWMCEELRMGIFDAAALVIAFYQGNAERIEREPP